MNTPNKFVTEIAVYLNENTDNKVYKFDDKPDTYHGEYIAVNALPFQYSKAVNDDNIININLHAPKNAKGKADRRRLDEMIEEIANLIPFAKPTEDSATLSLSLGDYAISHLSQPIEDNDGTYFINLKVRVFFNGI